MRDSAEKRQFRAGGMGELKDDDVLGFFDALGHNHGKHGLGHLAANFLLRPRHIGTGIKGCVGFQLGALLTGLTSRLLFLMRRSTRCLSRPHIGLAERV